jgi:hypothetical protein
MDLSPIACPRCQEDNLRNADNCKRCGESIGFVNVNLYSDRYFLNEIDNRFLNVMSISGDKRSELTSFEELINVNGKALINLNFKMLCLLILEKEDYLPYRMAVEKGKRVKASFLNDKDRCVVEASFYGIDGGKIVYAVLSLDDNGLTNYGKTTIILKTKTIEHRTSVFERNTYHLFDELKKNGWNIRGPIPPGHSCTWEYRGKLAVCKHGMEIVSGNSAPNFEKLLVKSGTDRGEDEFIELHIFNSLNYLAVEQITIHKQVDSEFDLLQMEILQEESKKIGISLIKK